MQGKDRMATHQHLQPIALPEPQKDGGKTVLASLWERKSIRRRRRSGRSHLCHEYRYRDRASTSTDLRLSRYRVTALQSTVSYGSTLCMIGMAAGMALSMLTKPPETMVLRKSSPVTTPATHSIAPSGVARFTWQTVMARYTSAASPISLWALNRIARIAFRRFVADAHVCSAAAL